MKSIEDLLGEVEGEVAAVEPPAETETAPLQGEGHNVSSFASDLGFADKIAKRFGDNIRFDLNRGQWLVFNPESGWGQDPSSHTLRGLVQGYVRELTAWAQKKAGTGVDLGSSDAAKKAAELITAMRNLGNTYRISNAIKEAQSIHRIGVKLDQIDADPHLIGLPNGVYDLNADRFKPHSKESMVTMRLGCSFDPSAQCPRFVAFMERVQPDLEMRSFIQRLAGSVLYAGNSDQKAPFFYGLGANGKSTFAEAIQHVMGGYCKPITESLLYTKGHQKSPDIEIAELYGARLALGTENSAGVGLNEGLLKAITGGEKIKGRGLYKSFVEFLPSFKIWLVGNHKPRIVGTDHGIWRRFLLVDWPVMIPDGEKDPGLKGKLEREASGILNWMLAGFRDWKANGLTPPASCIAMTESFRQESDTIGEFVNECIDENPGGAVSKADVYKAYQRWAEENGHKYPMAKSSLKQRLVLRGWDETTLTHGNQAAWVGKKVISSIDYGAI